MLGWRGGTFSLQVLQGSINGPVVIPGSWLHESDNISFCFGYQGLVLWGLQHVNACVSTRERERTYTL
jgi:hypothetical protein